MAGKGSLDKFANIAGMSLAMTAANTTTYGKFDFPFSVMDKTALLISRIEYILAGIDQLNSSGDYCIMGLSVRKDLTLITDVEDPAILDTTRLWRYDLGAAATGNFIQYPIIRDFSTLPSGGMIVAPNPLYFFVGSSGAGGVLSGYVRIWYTNLALADSEYWQLVESRRIITD